MVMYTENEKKMMVGRLNQRRNERNERRKINIYK